MARKEVGAGLFGIGIVFGIVLAVVLPRFVDWWIVVLAVAAFAVITLAGVAIYMRK